VLGPGLARRSQRPYGCPARALLGRIELADMLPRDLFGRIARDALRSRVPAGHGAFGVEHVDRIVDDGAYEQLKGIVTQVDAHYLPPVARAADTPLAPRLTHECACGCTAVVWAGARSPCKVTPWR